MKLNIGLVGLGDHWESRYLPALRAQSDRFEIRAICAEVALRATNAAKEFDAATVDGFRALSTREDIDAVLILSPEWFGHLPILAACDAGKAVYCASALDLPIEQAAEVRKHVEETGVAFMVELPRRHAPATVRLKELIATRLGKPNLLFCHLRKEQVARAANHSASRETSLKHDLLELVDWCRYMVGAEPTSVTGVSHEFDSKSQYQMMTLQFGESGGPDEVMAQVSCGQYLRPTWQEAINFRPPAALQVNCENGVAFVDLPSSLIWFDEAGRHMESLETERPVGEQLLGIFHRAVTSLVRRLDNLEDAYRAISILAKAEESGRSGRRIQID